MLLSRAFNLKIYGNKTKADTARYTSEKHLMYVRHWVNQLYFRHDGKAFSTDGMGMLANQAQHLARAIVGAERASTKATGNKSNVPQIRQIGCPARVEVSGTKHFDYWLSVENEFTRRGRIFLPCKSHVRLNRFLKEGWILNEASAELFYGRDGLAYARVFVQKEVAKALPVPEVLGCDVGYRNGVARSDGYIGKNIGKVIKTQKKKDQERRRQASLARKPFVARLKQDQIWFTGGGLPAKKVKTVVKQYLDIEARRAVGRSKRAGQSLCVESPKVIANLRSGSLQGWARNYFSARCRVIGAEEGVFVWEVNPAYTSITCNRCGKTDAKSRSGASFVCVACGHVAHADVNAGKNIAVKGRRSLSALLKRRVA